ncbi:unnamed protein product [Cuscuta europaea]|uniref:Uncharacterized protein n=1 Tax=Cuscuta europaea TaxID=41803 RepID=A0A9P0ZIU9_CUSEU|nr:unnamed protein product [Cuscuta europaea]
MDIEQVVSHLQNEVAHDPGVNVRFAIPNEKEIRCAARVQKEIDVPAYRTISFKGDGAQGKKPTNLPFEAPGLQWKGKKAISSTHLLNKMQRRRPSSIQVDLLEPTV